MREGKKAVLASARVGVEVDGPLRFLCAMRCCGVASLRAALYAVVAAADDDDDDDGN